MDLRGTEAAQRVGHSAEAGRTTGIWRLMSLMHQGPWTEIYRAQPADAAGSPRSDYVVKLARHRLEQQPEGALQIRNEVAAATAVRHPNVMTVLDQGLGAAQPYFVMPRVEGRTLEVILQNDVTQPLPVALWWTRQIAQGLAAIHTAAWIHRDLKPANILVGAQGHVTILDFGFATHANNLADPVFRGTPDFAAPEVLHGDAPANPAADIFALGCILKELLRAEGRASEVPEAVEELLHELRNVDPQHRPTAAGLVNRLLRLEIETLGQHIRPSARAA